MGRGTRCLCGLANITLVKHSLQQLTGPIQRGRCTLHREWETDREEGALHFSNICQRYPLLFDYRRKFAG